MVTFNPTWVQLLTLAVTLLLPALVGLVTTRVTEPGIKATLLAALAAITGFGSELLASLNAGTVYDAGAGLFSAVLAFGTAVVIHYGLLKPTGISTALQDVGTSKHRA